MIIELLLKGEYRRGDDDQNSQYEYYYYDYIPELMALVIVLDTAPASVFKTRFTHVRSKSDQVDHMRGVLARGLESIGIIPKNVQFYSEDQVTVPELEKYQGKNILVINSRELHNMRDYHQPFNNNYSIKEQKHMAIIDLLTMLNLTIPTDFLPDLLNIIENNNHFFGFKVDEVGAVKSYTFFVKHECSERLKNNLIQLLHKMIIKLVGPEVGTNENVKLVVPDAGMAITVNELAINKIQEINSAFKKESNPTLYSADVTEHYIGNAWQAESLFKYRIFEQPSIKYEDKKAHLKLIVDTFTQLNDLDEVIKLYAFVKDHHNQIDIHKHSFIDLLLGKSNTTSWQEAMKQIRAHALSLLETKLKAQKDDAEAKKKIVEQYNKSPIFTDHRSNNPFRFFYKPKILKSLDLTREKYSEIIRSAVNKVR